MDTSDANEVSSDATGGCYDTPVTYDEAVENKQGHYASAKFEPDEVEQVG